MAFLEVSFFSSVLGMCTNMNVILPQTVRGMIGVNAKDMTATYPTLYLLHGMSDDHSIWHRRTSIERYADEAGIAVVMPTTELGWYTDCKHGRKWRTFIGEELPQICHDLFPRMSDKREETFVAGLSMGGYGAFAIALTYPERFSFAGGLSGGYLPMSREDRKVDTYWTDIFGTYEEYVGGPNDLLALSAKRMEAHKADPAANPIPRLYMWCGTEDFLYQSNLTVRDHLQSLGWPDFTYEESPGTHAWQYWDDKIQTVIRLIRE